MDQRTERANHRYERAVFGGDSSGLSAAEQGLDVLAADLALAHLDEARLIADVSGAQGVRRTVEEARANPA